MIVDTDVLIWYILGNERANKDIMRAWPFSISSVTLMELLLTARSDEERKTIEAALAKWETKVVHVTEEISIMATQYIREFGVDSMTIQEALIAATAVSLGEPLLCDKSRLIRRIEIPSLTVKVFWSGEF